MKRFLLLFALFGCLTAFAGAQTTAFNFQGRLNDGSNPANGSYDLQFKLFDSIAGGNQVGATVSKSNQQLINGVFSTQLDFGAAAFTGGDRFLEIALRPAGSPNAFVILGARQQLMSVPYSVKSVNSTNSTNATNAQNANNFGNLPPGRFVQQDENGNVGIGGNNPNYKLYVNGNVRNTGNLTLDGSSLTGGNSTVNGNSEVGGNLKVLNSAEVKDLKVTGKTTQPLEGYGLPKAMLKVNADGTIAKCYNGVTGNSTGNCGYTVDRFTVGGYGINFGFGTDASFVFVTVEFDRTNGEFVAANYSTSAFFGHLDVYTFRFPNAKPTTPYDRPFMIVLF
jgi:hypothetical protein